MRSNHAFPLAALLSLSAAACGSSSADCTDPSTPGCMVASEKQRVEAPAVSDGDLRAAVAGNTAFAVDLYQGLRAQPGNVFYSPFSVSEALAMTWAGAGGDTATQMAKALRFTLDQGKLHPAFDAIDLALASRAQGAEGKDGQGFRLNVANALWGQIGYAFQAPFLDTLAQSYGAGMHVADFEASPDPSRALINQWVSDRTEQKIPELLGEGTITSDTKLVLTNAVYFNAAWATPFHAADTSTAAFTREDGSAVQVPTMHGDQEAGFTKGDGYQAVDLPYSGNQLSMTLILPDAGTLDAFEAALTGETLQALLAGMSSSDVTISMPKFKIESSFGLADELGKLGMVDAFTDKADFSGISKQSKLFISAVVHKAFVDVDENGTEAAAATAVVLGDASLPEPQEIKLDHPFLVLIRDQPTGTILFLGRVSDPQG